MDTKQGKKQPIVHVHDIMHCHSPEIIRPKDCFHLGPLSLDIYEDEILIILGPSGSGKTTLLRTIAGLEQARAGQITINGRVVVDKHVFVSPEKRRVGMVFQDHALFPHFTARQNILFGLRRWPKIEQEARLRELEQLLELQHHLDRYPHELSGGQQQRIALARTLAPRPMIILLDEPLSNIDAELRTTLAQELRHTLKKSGVAVVWVTHDQTEALDLADRIVVLNDGKVEQVDTPRNLYNQPKTRFVADFVGHAVFIKGDLKEGTIFTEIGAVSCQPCLTSSKKFEVMIRPDDVQAVPDEDGKGTVFKRQFFGSTQLYSVKLASGQTILVRQAPHINWPLGTKVKISLNTDYAVAFPV